MGRKAFIFVMFLSLIPSRLYSVGGFEHLDEFRLTAQPVTIILSDQVTGKGADLKPLQNMISLRSLSPDGKHHSVTDIHGNASWSMEKRLNRDTFQVLPSPKNYAGPVEVLINDKVISRFRPLTASSRVLILEKVLSATMPDGMVLRVHFTDFALESLKDERFPYRVLDVMKKSYSLLINEMGFTYRGAKDTLSIDAYLGDDNVNGLLPFGGFDDKDFRRAPLFVIKVDESTSLKRRAILLPVDYQKFLNFWNQINHVPFRQDTNQERDLAGSVMHEMTHAVLHAYHENLGSTEHRIRSGDWYTEGLARYFETKIGSYSGFASQGFRRILKDKIQFSRGGANYYLRYPDESFFSLRYEASLFWYYFEMKYGMKSIVRLTEKLKNLSFDASTRVYVQVLEETVGENPHRVLDDFFNWIYRGEYLEDPACTYLQHVARTKSVWQNGFFRLFSSRGKEVLRDRVLRTDWVSEWGEDESEGLKDTTAGDWDSAAGIQPLAFDVHEILIGKPDTPSQMIIHNLGGSSHLAATLYLDDGQNVHVVKRDFRTRAVFRFKDFVQGGIIKISLVLSNLDLEKDSPYSIQLR